MSFSIREVSTMLGITPAQIRVYADKGFLSPERGEKGDLRFGFHDLVILRTAGELLAAQIPHRKVRRVLERLREQLPAGRSLSAIRITTDGQRVIVRDGDSIWNPESGQALFDFSVAELTEKVAPLLLRAATNAKANDHTTAQEWYELAYDLEVTSPDEARAAYERALELDAEHPDAHVNLGRLLHEAGKPAQAERHYRAALTIVPDHETAAFNLGVALEDLGRTDDAIEAYTRALQSDATNADAHYNLAGIYERRGEQATAFRHLKQYKRLAE